MSDPIHIHTNFSWPYPEALKWMTEQRDNLLKTGKITIGVGAHDRDLVTLGRHTLDTDIVDLSALQQREVPVYRIERGGKATIHGPGQIVVYPIVSLARLQLSVPQFTALCEKAMIDCLETFQLEAYTNDGQPGVFVNDKKIGAIGFHASQSCITHGISLNVSNDLNLYNAIASCGVRNAGVCSIYSMTTQHPNIESVAKILTSCLTARLFN